MIFHLPGIIQRHKLLIYNLRTQRKFRLWPASGFNSEDVEQDQGTDKFLYTISSESELFLFRFSRDLNFTIQTSIKD